MPHQLYHPAQIADITELSSKVDQIIAAMAKAAGRVRTAA